MILTGSEIEKQIILGNIHIFPYSKEFLNPNSYNYRLAKELLEIIDSPIDPRLKSRYKKIQISDAGYVLMPGKLYLGSTVEELGSDKYVTLLNGRSSTGRLGLFLQITADLGHVGIKHCWTLELKVVQPLIVYPYMKIGQVSFWNNSGTLKALYQGEYGRYSTPYCSTIHHEFVVGENDQ